MATIQDSPHAIPKSLRIFRYRNTMTKRKAEENIQDEADTGIFIKRSKTTFDMQRVIYYRHHRSGLFTPREDPADVASMTIGIQAQNMVHACMQIYHRSNGRWDLETIKQFIASGKMCRV